MYFFPLDVRELAIEVSLTLDYSIELFQDPISIGKLLLGTASGKTGFAPTFQTKVRIGHLETSMSTLESEFENACFHFRARFLVFYVKATNQTALPPERECNATFDIKHGIFTLF